MILQISLLVKKLWIFFGLSFSHQLFSLSCNVLTTLHGEKFCNEVCEHGPVFCVGVELQKQFNKWAKHLSTF